RAGPAAGSALVLLETSLRWHSHAALVVNGGEDVVGHAAQRFLEAADRSGAVKIVKQAVLALGVRDPQDVEQRQRRAGGRRKIEGGAVAGANGESRRASAVAADLEAVGDGRCAG